MKQNKYIAATTILLIMLVFNCKEELELETQDFESALVVEATITNELKHHEISISRTSLLEAANQVFENNATVSVSDDTGNSFNFSQNEEGKYISDIAFEAVPDRLYNLHIITVSGKEYKSTNTELTPISQIDNLYTEYVDDEVNGPGVQLFIDSQNNDNQAQYFRYEYVETYKLIVPFSYNIGLTFSNFFQDLTMCGSDVDVQSFYDVDFFEKTQEEQTCYSSNRNTNIIQTTTTNLNENFISRQPIRFIPEENDIDSLDISMLRERYSIKVKQYVQNIEAYTYYKTIAQLGDNESVLSENQPGFVQGNIRSSSSNSDSERIIGFFEVASVSEKRIFFNHEDVNIPYPEYLYECDQQILDFKDNLTVCDDDQNDRNELYNYVTREGYKLTNYDDATKFYTIAKQECVNCTSAGTNVQPDFWIN